MKEQCMPTVGTGRLGRHLGWVTAEKSEGGGDSGETILPKVEKEVGPLRMSTPGQS